MTESVRELLGELHAERVRTWPPEDVEINVVQRGELVEAFDPSKIKGVGFQLDNFEFANVHGGHFSLDEVVRNGPAVLIMFRYAGCPACNIALPYYHRNLWPQLQELGVSLVAISPQVPARLGAIQKRHDLQFTVASDPENRFSNYLGITYSANQPIVEYNLRQGIDLPKTLGTKSADFPQTTVLIIDQNRVIRFIDVTPDWLARTEAGPILDAVTALTVGAIA